MSYWGNADFWLDEDDKFHFVKKKGIRRENVVFRLHNGEAGNNIASLEIMSTKQQLYNKVVVIGAGEGIEKNIASAEDGQHQQKYGLREIVVPARTLDTFDSANEYAKNFEWYKANQKKIIKDWNMPDYNW